MARRPNGYWTYFSHVEKELNEFIEELGRFPTQSEVQTSNAHLLGGIKRHGGMNAVRKKMGYSYIKCPDGYYREFENVRNELEIVIERIGHFPTHKELGELKLTGLSAAISQYHGGFSNARKIMGYSLIERSKAYWKKWENLQSELECLISDTGRFPTNGDLREMKRTDVENAINKYYGGIAEVAIKMGYKSAKQAQKYWMRWENVNCEINDCVNILGHFPSSRELKRLRRFALGVAISKYYGGFPAVRKKMNMTTTESIELQGLLETYVK